MNILNTLAPVGAPNGSAVALGYFDGVHLGHRRVLGAAVEYAAAHGLTPAAFTFSLPGGQSLKGGRILSAGQKHARVAALGITAYMEPPFESFRSLSPEDFVNKILVECFAAKAVFCGDNFTFGAYAAGNVDRLKELCAPLGIAVTIVDMAQYGGQTVSSTRIRAALEEGRIEDANAIPIDGGLDRGVVREQLLEGLACLDDRPTALTGRCATARASAPPSWANPPSTRTIPQTLCSPAPACT